MQRLTTICASFFFLMSIYSNAQQASYLEKKLSLSFTNETFEHVFKSISEQTGVVFSYNPKQFDADKRITILAANMPLKGVLDRMFAGTGFTYKVKKNYIIVAQVKSTAPSLYRIEGVVYNSIDSSSLMDVSVYSGKYKVSVVTNDQGYFTFTLPQKGDVLELTIAKENFHDTTLVLSNSLSRKLSLYISPKQIDITVSQSDGVENDIVDDLLLFRQNLEQRKKEQDNNDFIAGWLAKRRNKANLRNISDTLFSNFSVSFVPYVSTNKLLSINTMNKYSFNILAGYSKGTEKFELGGVININNGPVSYGQIAGVGNVVSEGVKGAQIGGAFNIVQKDVAGFQVGGAFNTTGSFKGAQIGGAFNQNRDTLKGLQLAGVFNNSKDVSGVQLAGVFNRAKSIKGAQISGLVNYSKNVKGLQLGVINIADTCNGLPIGLLSIVKNGYHKLELGVNESGIATIGFSSGVEKFHTMFFAGIPIMPNPEYFAYGYGIGSSYKLSKRFYLGIDITSQQTQPLDIIDKIYLNLHNKAQLNVEFEVFKKLRIAAGPSFNVMVADNSSPYYPNIAALYSPRVIFNETSSFSSNTTTMWIGAGASLKLF